MARPSLSHRVTENVTIGQFSRITTPGQIIGFIYFAYCYVSKIPLGYSATKYSLQAVRKKYF